MVSFQDLSKGYWVQGVYRPVISHLTLDLPAGKSLALLGANGAGKSTLLRLIAGKLRPDRGEVLRRGSVSWPVGQAGGAHRDLTGAQNTRFLARVYGVDTDELLAFVEDFAEIGVYFHMPLRSYSQGMRSRLMFGLSMGIGFDCYLVDEVTAVGDDRFRHKSRTVFRDRIARSGAIMVSHNLTELQDFCDAALLLHAGRVEYFEDLAAAISCHKALLA